MRERERENEYEGERKSTKEVLVVKLKVNKSATSQSGKPRKGRVSTSFADSSLKRFNSRGLTDERIERFNSEKYSTKLEIKYSSSSLKRGNLTFIQVSI